MPDPIEVRCPNCGGTDDFRYLEDIVSHRNVRGIVRLPDDAPPVLEIEGRYESGEGYDDGSNPRLECRNRHQVRGNDGRLREETCAHEFPIPDGVELDFV